MPASNLHSRAIQFEDALHLKGLERSVFFLHVPKTGGQTIQDLLAKNYRPRQVLHLNQQVYEKAPGLYRDWPSSPHLLMGHHTVRSQIFTELSAPTFVFTLIRDPVKRVLSYYNYLRGKATGTLATLAKRLALRDFLIHPKMSECRNGMARRFSSFDCFRDLFEDEILDDCKQNLEHCFTVFSSVEELQSLVTFLAVSLRLCEPFAERRNVAQSIEHRPEVTSEERELIVDLNSIDITLYEWATKLSKQRFSQMKGLNSTQLMLADLEREWIRLRCSVTENLKMS